MTERETQILREIKLLPILCLNCKPKPGFYEVRQKYSLILAEIAGKVYMSAKTIARAFPLQQPLSGKVLDLQLQGRLRKKISGQEEGQTGQRKFEGGDNL